MDDNLERGFINKQQILEYVSEAEIFSLVFGFVPIEYRYVTSPFREDSNPGCWFHTDAASGKLRFVDFANEQTINGINMNNIDCFDAVQVYFKLSNFYKVLDFIKTNLIEGKGIKHKIKVIKAKPKKQVLIHIDPRDFDSRDRRFWSKYGISKQNLIDDKVFPVRRFNLINSRNGDVLRRVHDPCYSFNGFDGDRKKLYRPFQKGKNRFITNCKADDVGEIDSLVQYGQQLVISKSYKDCRILRNHNLDSIWFQNEGMIPSDEILIELCKRFTNIVVFFDNDEPGITASEKVRDVINRYFPGKARNLYLPEYLYTDFGITDPADLYKSKGPKHLQNFINENL